MIHIPRVLIIGDAMLDTYVYGSVSRVSPEAPIPVVCPYQTEDRPGGAANVACNAASLGARVAALFVLGVDEQAARLKDKLDSYGVDTQWICKGKDLHTVNKIRLTGNGQQITRIDLYDCNVLDAELENALLKRFEELLPEQDMVILSDYGKGTCTPTVCQKIITLAGNAGKRVIVDPKGTAWDKYRGAFLITPNMKELNLLTGRSVPNDDVAIETAYRGLCRELGIQHLLLTRSEKGMSLIDEKTVLHIPTQARAVNDVSGAGDTVVAALAVMLAMAPMDLEGAVRFSNAAAGVVVGKPGTATVCMEEVQASQPEASGAAENPRLFTLADRSALEETVRRWRAAGETIVTTNGCFDILHAGHLRLLREAKKQGDRLVVAINSDAAVKRLKGPQRPINSEAMRGELLLALRMVDAVAVFDPQKEPDVLTDVEYARLSPKARAAAPEAPMALMRGICPDVHVKGGDYTQEDVPEALFAKRLVLVPYVPGYSTTGIIEKSKYHE